MTLPGSHPPALMEGTWWINTPPSRPLGGMLSGKGPSLAPRISPGAQPQFLAYTVYPLMSVLPSLFHFPTPLLGITSQTTCFMQVLISRSASRGPKFIQVDCVTPSSSHPLRLMGSTTAFIIQQRKPKCPRDRAGEGLLKVRRRLRAAGPGVLCEQVCTALTLCACRGRHTPATFSQIKAAQLLVRRRNTYRADAAKPQTKDRLSLLCKHTCTIYFFLGQ